MKNELAVMYVEYNNESLSIEELNLIRRYLDEQLTEALVSHIILREKSTFFGKEVERLKKEIKKIDVILDNNMWFSV